MLRPIYRQSCIFSARITLPHFPRRLFASAAAATADLQPSLPPPTRHEKIHEDRTLRQLFDSQHFWQEFSHQSPVKSIEAPGGLFRNRYLTKPSGFLEFARDTRERCQKTVKDVLRASSTEEYRKIPHQLDILSDSLCRVLDVADFVRATHPDAHFQDGAAQAYALLWEYMNILNTTPGLYTQLQKAISTSEVCSLWSEEETTVARILLKDFSNSAINLPEIQRKSFVSFSNDMKELGHQFLDEMGQRQQCLYFDKGQLTGMDPTLLQHFRPAKRGQISLPTIGDMAYTALASVEDEDVRRRIYIAGRQAPRDQLDILEELMSTRAAISRLAGYDTYAEMNLADKMAKSPEAVTSFLTALAADNTPYVARELEKMKKMKEEVGKSSPIAPWDIIYYRHRLNAKLQSKSRKPDFLSAYFSLGTVMQGLSRLFDRLYGIRFVPRQLSRGEAWAPDVRRLDVIHEDEGHVAVLYADLFARNGKAPNPAHFTLRCSRLISSSEISEVSGNSQLASDGMATAISPVDNERYQLPTIALICDFPHPPNPHTPTLLSFRDLQTLFHEMGHAIHSILGRTSHQVVSGTRCATDFAELPSVLMESFASDPSVLNLFARHWETDEPLPYEMVKDILDTQKRGQGLQTETQILYSLLDQAYHSALPFSANFDSSKVFFDIYDKYGSLREPRETTAQGFFGHLVEYGGTYYSYLFDRAIAGRVWNQVFRDGKHGGGVDREAGERFKNEVLKWGGGRNPWACVSAVLGDEKLKEGGKEAMEEVGRWGVHD